MKIAIITIISIGILQIACNNNKQIKIAKMANIMADIHLADSYAAIAYQTDTNANHKNGLHKNIDTLKKYYTIIFESNGIAEKEFMNNIVFYQSNAILWDSLYSLTQKRLDNVKPKKKV
jgi:hypothetical protein